MNAINEIESKIVSRYKERFEKDGFPNWAFQYFPPAPHVGNDIPLKNVICLAYGSAENLTNSFCQPKAELNRLNEAQWYRHRFFRKNDEYFPNLHIQPIENGSLLIAVRYILALLGYDEEFSNTPKNFIEEIVVGNFSKYSIRAKKNIDPIKFQYLKESLEYVSLDLEEIKPDILILPKTIFDFSAIRKLILGLLKKGSRIVPIYQTNRRVIGGRALNKQIDVDNSRKPYDFSFQQPWINSISNSGINSNEMKKYLLWLNNRIEKIVVEVK